eukprot:TRINITY_DN19938_c0_g1_i1.p3 TRINITY_DN19938_c0_g1~~TRINITY_DN19938_c0_g1_i1.p3  ORF type:complete len:109 (+),score=2.23 TRINITY_DN19938_c0_g1_i1:1909-2235(+)
MMCFLLQFLVFFCLPVSRLRIAANAMSLMRTGKAGTGCCRDGEENSAAKENRSKSFKDSPSYCLLPSNILCLLFAMLSLYMPGLAASNANQETVIITKVNGLRCDWLI